MRHLFQLVVASLVLALLAACGRAPAGEPIAIPTVGAPAAEPTVAAEPTPVFEPVDDTAEAAPAATAAPTSAPEPAAPAISGTLDWRDVVLRSDGLSIQIDGLPEPSTGEVYAAWLANNDTTLPLGQLRLNNGRASLEYAAPDQVNLVGIYDRVYIARSPQDEATTSLDTVVLNGSVPPGAMLHVRHVLSGIAVTPNGVGFVVGLRAETDELLRHAQFLRDAMEAGDLPLERRHAEHLINIIRGSEARDADGNGQVENPGDGFGLLPNGAQDGYIKGMIDHARLAAEADDAPETVKIHAEHVIIAGENTRQRIEEIRSLAERILTAQDVEGTRQDVLALLSLAEQTIQGADTDRDEQIEPVAGEGGVVVAYQHAQFMAGMVLGSGVGQLLPPPTAHGDGEHSAAEPTAAAEPAAEPTAAPAAEPTAAPAAPAPSEVIVSMIDFAFEPAEIRVPVGTTIVWPNNGQKQHSATAVDGSFDTGLYGPGVSRSITMNTPGTFRYYCVLHAPPDGSSGMSGTIIVE